MTEGIDSRSTQEFDVTNKVVELIKSAGIGSQNKLYIKTGYKLWLASTFPYVADIAIVDGKDEIKAVFEIKASPRKDIESVARYLYAAINRQYPCYIVTGNEIAEVSGTNDIKWEKLGSIVKSLRERLVPKKTETVTIDSVGDYLNEITRVKTQKATIKFLYRGESADYSNHHNGAAILTPSLFRRFSPDNDDGSGLERQTYYNEEEYLIQEAYRIFPMAFSDCKTDIDKLAVAQHFGIPTRLLDVTGNALVALYFAAQDTGISEDGVVYVFRASLNDYKSASTGGQTKKITIEGFHNGRLKALKDTYKKPRLIFPTFRTQRQMVQDGAFYLFGNDVKPVRLCGFSDQDYRKIIIPKSSKQKLLSQLEEKCNIHKGTLFPELLSNYEDKLVRDARARIAAEVLILDNKSKAKCPCI